MSELQNPPLTLEMLLTRKCTLTPSSVVFTFELAFESFKEFEDVSTMNYHMHMDYHKKISTLPNVLEKSCIYMLITNIGDNLFL
jgi:hypothetical protein